AAVCVARRGARARRALPRPLRADPRLRPGHRGSGPGEPARGDPLRRHALPLLARRAGGGGGHRARRGGGDRGGPPHGRCRDARVHACGQVAAVKVTRVPADLGRLRKSLNALTPEDIAVREIAVVDDAFDPRREARSRVYEYRVLNTPAPSPFWRRHAWHVPE